MDTEIGIRGYFSGGYPSGKGLWDWTDPVLGIQRSAPPSTGIAGMLLLDLTGQSSFTNEMTGENLFASSHPERQVHVGLQVGAGYQKSFK